MKLDIVETMYIPLAVSDYAHTTVEDAVVPKVVTSKLKVAIR